MIHVFHDEHGLFAISNDSSYNIITSKIEKYVRNYSNIFLLTKQTMRIWLLLTHYTTYTWMSKLREISHLFNKVIPELFPSSSVVLQCHGTGD